MGSISIKVRGLNGVNNIKGEDLAIEESLALIELAKTIVLSSNGMSSEFSSVTAPLTALVSANTYSTTDVLHTEVQASEDDSKGECSHDEDNTNVEPTTFDEPVTSEDTNDLVSTRGVPSIAEAMSTAFANKFGTTPTTAVEDDSMLSVEERIEALNVNFYETGVKYKLYGGEILPFYRVRWECPKCAERGNHYGPENIKQMFCYNCNAALTVRPAAGRFPKRDDWGNFFIADELNLKYMRL